VVVGSTCLGEGPDLLNYRGHGIWWLLWKREEDTKKWKINRSVTQVKSGAFATTCLFSNDSWY
jgi:hypothetical protein